MIDMLDKLSQFYALEVDDDASFSLPVELAEELRREMINSDVGTKFMDLQIGGTEDFNHTLTKVLLSGEYASKSKANASDCKLFLSLLLQGHKPVVNTIKLRDFICDDEVEVKLPSGLMLVGGLSAVGKSTLLRYMRSGIDFPIALFDEPDLPGLSSESTLQQLLNDFLHSDKVHMLAIDSLTSFITAKKGDAAAAGGLSNMFFTHLPRLSNLLVAYNKLLVINVNFLSNYNNVEGLHTLLAGRTSAYIGFTDVGRFNITTRVSKSSRTAREYAIPKPEQKKIQIQKGKPGVSMNISKDANLSVLRQIINKIN